MAVENFEQILQSINNSEIRIALERLFAMAGIGPGSDGTSLSQNVVGDVTGDLTGDVTGNVVGNVTGAQTGNRKDTIGTLVVDTDLNDGGFTTQHVHLDGSSASVAVTKFKPVVGRLYIIVCDDATSAVSVTCSSGGTFDGTNSVATFDAAGETLIVYAISTTQMVIFENIGSVTLS